MVRAGHRALLLPAISPTAGRLHPHRNTQRQHRGNHHPGPHTGQPAPAPHLQRRAMAPPMASGAELPTHQNPTNATKRPQNRTPQRRNHRLVVISTRPCPLVATTTRRTTQSALCQLPSRLSKLRHRHLQIQRLLSLGTQPSALRFQIAMSKLRLHLSQQQPHKRRLYLRRVCRRRIWLFRRRGPHLPLCRHLSPRPMPRLSRRHQRTNRQPPRYLPRRRTHTQTRPHAPALRHRRTLPRRSTPVPLWTLKRRRRTLGLGTARLGRGIRPRCCLAKKRHHPLQHRHSLPHRKPRHGL